MWPSTTPPPPQKPGVGAGGLGVVVPESRPLEIGYDWQLQGALQPLLEEEEEEDAEERRSGEGKIFLGIGELSNLLEFLVAPSHPVL